MDFINLSIDRISKNALGSNALDNLCEVKNCEVVHALKNPYLTMFDKTLDNFLECVQDQSSALCCQRISCLKVHSVDSW